MSLEITNKGVTFFTGKKSKFLLNQQEAEHHDINLIC